MMRIVDCIRSFPACVFLLVAAMIMSGSVDASQRFALVIGNSDYTNGTLLNPRNDAMDMAEQLRSMGYEIYGGGASLDLDRIGIERTIRAFARSLPENANALFYFAGHGISTPNDNYLIPVNHNLEFTEQLPDRAVSLKSTVELFKNSNPEGINVVLLDACRDSPLESNYRSNRQGLQKLNDIPRGVFIGYAADSGQVAEDGDGRNGTYTKELLKIMKEKPSVIIEVAHKEVASRVFEKTEGKQFPVSENKVYGDWCFGTCGDEPIVSSNTGFQTEPETQTGTTVPVESTRSQSRSLNWKVIGGVALGALVVGAALQNDDDGGAIPASQFQLILEPPQ